MSKSKLKKVFLGTIISFLVVNISYILLLVPSTTNYERFIYDSFLSSASAERCEVSIVAQKDLELPHYNATSLIRTYLLQDSKKVVLTRSDESLIKNRELFCSSSTEKYIYSERALKLIRNNNAKDFVFEYRKNVYFANFVKCLIFSLFFGVVISFYVFSGENKK